MAQQTTATHHPVIDITEAEPLTIQLDSFDYEASTQQVPLPRVRYSRPSAPALDFSRPVACPPLPLESVSNSSATAHVDLNATTLVSARWDPSPDSERPSTRRNGGWVKVEVEEAAPCEPVDELDLDGDFFSAGHDSYPPIIEDLAPIEPPESLMLTAAETHRRAILRRTVACAVGAVALMAVGLVAKAAVSAAPVVAERHQATAAAIIAHEAPAATARLAKARAAAASLAAADEDPVARAEEPSSEASFDEVAAETLRLLNARQFDQAAVQARQLIASNPKSAFGYRCLGSALQDLGDYAAARAVYSDCIQQATEGDVLECSALGGR